MFLYFTEQSFKIFYFFHVSVGQLHGTLDKIFVHVVVYRTLV